MISLTKTQFSDLPSEIRLQIWHHALGYLTQIQTLSIFDTKLYEANPKDEKSISVNTHWSIVSVPKRSIPSALLTCRETWTMRNIYNVGRQEGHRLVNPASIDVLRNDPGRFYQKTVYSPVPRTEEDEQDVLTHPGELLHFRPFANTIKTSPCHTTEVTSRSRPMTFKGIKYLAISYTDLYYFKYGGPNVIKFHGIQVLFVLKPTFDEREDNPCTLEEYNIGLRYANDWGLRYTDIFAVWDYEVDRLHVNIVRVETLDDALKEIKQMEKDGEGEEAVDWEWVSGEKRPISALGDPQRNAREYETNCWKAEDDGLIWPELWTWDFGSGLWW